MLDLVVLLNLITRQTGAWSGGPPCSCGHSAGALLSCLMIAIGLLPGLAGDFSFPDNLTAYMVFLLGSLLAAVLVWPVAITSWKGRARQTHQA